MFVGEYQHSIDPKGRIIIPAKFRNRLGDMFYLAKGMESCLYLYPEAQWNELSDKISKLPLAEDNARKFARYFFAGATECEIDKQGRILIPTNFRDYAELQKEIYVNGANTRVEIWSKHMWEEHLALIASEYPYIIKTMAGLGI